MPIQPKQISGVDKDTTPLQLSTLVQGLFNDISDQLNAEPTVFYSRNTTPSGAKEGDLFISRASGPLALLVASKPNKFDPVPCPLADEVAANTAATVTNAAAIATVAANLGTITGAIFSASAALTWTSTAAGTSADRTITVTGALAGRTVVLGVPNASIQPNSSFTAWVSAANIVTVRFNNYSAGALTPANGTFRVLVIHI